MLMVCGRCFHILEEVVNTIDSIIFQCQFLENQKSFNFDFYVIKYIEK